MNIKKRKENQIWHIIVKIMLGMVVLVFLGAVAFLALQISGKNRLYSNADNTEMLAALSGMATELGGEQEEGGESTTATTKTS